MPLILGMHEGDEFFVGADGFVVSEILGKFKFKLTRSDGREFTIGHLFSAEVAQDVFVQAGLYPQNGIARVSIDAPRELEITRPDYYDEEPAE